MGMPKVPDGQRDPASRVGLLPTHLFLSQDLLRWGNARFRSDNSLVPVILSDAAAENNSLYFSNTVDKLVYKDPNGVVHPLY